MNADWGTTQRLAELLAQLAHGHEKARAELIEHAGERLRRLCRKLLHAYPRVRRWEETDDVLQRAELRLYHSLAQVRPESVRAFLGLAATQIRRVLIDLARHYSGPECFAAHHHTDRPDVGREGCQLDRLPGPPSTAAPVWVELLELVETLPAGDQELFNLMFTEELTQPEAAKLLGISERTLKRRWRNLRLKLHAALEGRWSL